MNSPRNQRPRAISLALAAAALAACQQAAVVSHVPDNDGGGSSSPTGGGDDRDGGGSKAPPSFGPLPDGGAGGSTGNPFMDTPKCAEDIHMAERVPLDLLLLVDRSDSMAGAKWQMATRALTSFVKDPRSAGLAVGLQFFPVSEVDRACTREADCGDQGGQAGPFCLERRICLGAALGGTLPQLCGSPTDPACPAGSTCVPLGQCPLSGTYCTGLGKPCPGGPATDLCAPLGKTCRTANFSESCNPEPYGQQLSMNIGPLPLAEAALTRAIGDAHPGGGTPMAEAMKGTARYLRAYAAAHAGHRVALILATDGVPSHCGIAMPEDSVAADIRALQMSTPAISTYVIGIFSAMEVPTGPPSVNRFAMAGGTGTGFVLTPTSDLTEKLLGALNQIRGAALPCEFTIPTPTSGMLDFGKVNVHFKGATFEDNIPYVGSADKCDPMRGGWYYDTDPAVADPKKVVVCEKTCSQFKADPAGKVQIGFGCKTVVIK